MKFRFPRIAVLVIVTGTTAAALAASPGRPQAELRCDSFGPGPKLHCTVQLKAADGAPLKDANVMLGATMPSMPMAHSVKPVPAEPTAKAGEYRGTLGLAMTGVWAVQIDVSGPARDRIVKSLRIECEGDKRCAAPPATGGGAAHEPKHKL